MDKIQSDVFSMYWMEIEESMRELTDIAMYRPLFW